ncbi:MAG: PRD domain-containing protein [Erysipelotrichaceae bacterium]|uniref:BglG family transcription antiterminator LicT n=1 Tax=Floccifex sp. TaxID=2815810 RepID=UPI002A75D725|nr:PRD domain-containing protein [Floccifex sp.]MDD7281915.1 PRD domain-containing protein [Erysipelotrichaceae bacterium]MDY2958125.1 PRD domain-containing protein [Floccifex sp.]
MRISKILNNNSVVALDDNHQETVLIGKGLAFNKKVGDPVNVAAIQKKFCLSSQTLNTKFQEILVSLPLEEVSVVSKIVNYMKMNISKKISDVIYVSLSDHIHYALRNHAKGIVVKNGLMFDIMRFYPDEYQIGLKGLEIIKEETGVQLSVDEAGFIALHIVNAETEHGIGTGKVEKSTKIIKEVLDIVTNFFDTEINEESLTYFRFINHLKYFSQRIVSNAIFEDDDKDEELLDMMKITYAQSYMCATNIQEFIRAKYNVSIGKQELLYLVIHIQRAIFQK